MKHLALILIALSFAPQTHASTRSYSFPMQGDHRLSACLADGATCGKPVADAFCKTQGFAESIMFAREKVDAARPFDLPDDKAAGPQDAFKRIKCYQPVTPAQAATTN
jgi:hypothetical protein